VITGLACRQAHDQRAALAVNNGMQL
jgi:hypothetical protein